MEYSEMRQAILDAADLGVRSGLLIDLDEIVKERDDTINNEREMLEEKNKYIESLEAQNESLRMANAKMTARGWDREEDYDDVEDEAEEVVVKTIDELLGGI